MNEDGTQAGDARPETAAVALRVLMLSDGIAGHFRQSEGIVAALSRRHDVNLQRIELPRRLGPLRRLLGLLARSGIALPLGWHLGKAAGNVTSADLIVSSGGRTLAANVAAARAFKAPNLFSGSPRQFPPELFAQVLLSYPTADRRMRYVLKPTALDPDRLPAPRPLLEGTQDHPIRIAVLVGGPTQPCPWSEADWQDLMALLASLADQSTMRLTIVTSRRTPDIWADALASLLRDRPGLERLIDFRTAGPGSIDVAFASDALIVTGDSMSMVTESVAARRPVAVVMPKSHKVSRDDATMDDLARQGRIAPCRVDRTSAEDLQAALARLVPMTSNHLDDLADIVAAVLGKPRTHA